MACRLVGAKPLSEPMLEYCQLDPWETSIEIHTFSFKKIHLKISSAKWRPFYLGLNVLNVWVKYLVWNFKDTDAKYLTHELLNAWVKYLVWNFKNTHAKYLTHELLNAWVKSSVEFQRYSRKIPYP